MWGIQCKEFMGFVWEFNIRWEYLRLDLHIPFQSINMKELNLLRLCGCSLVIQCLIAS